MMTRLVASGIAALCLPVVLLGAAASGITPTGGGSRALCLPTPASAPRHGDTGAQRLSLDTRQRRNARVIVSVAARMRLPRRAAVIAVAAAYQESRLRNLRRGHLDSLGLFQQRPSAGWGSAEQILDPRYAARQFYTHLRHVPGWRRMPLSQAAQAVQHSAHPDAYAQWKSLARRIVTSLTAASCPTGPAAGGQWPHQDMLPMGLTPRTLRVKRLIERLWNEHRIGGYCPGGCTTGHIEGSDHYDGHAIDVMILPWRDPDRAAKGRAITRWLVTHHQQLAIKYVIYRERIWIPDQGWHPYTHPSGNSSDPTLRHMDHIHVSVY